MTRNDPEVALQNGYTTGRIVATSIVCVLPWLGSNNAQNVSYL
jgi:hypothetical protein